MTSRAGIGWSRGTSFQTAGFRERERKKYRRKKCALIRPESGKVGEFGFVSYSGGESRIKTMLSVSLICSLKHFSNGKEMVTFGQHDSLLPGNLFIMARARAA